jgi:putative chitinase
LIVLKEWLVSAGCPAVTASEWAYQIEPAMERFDIDSNVRAAHFLAQCAHESAGFTRLEENLNYSEEALMRVWPGRFPPSVAMVYARKAQSIANRAYADRMGNKDEASGDGWRFRGRGLIQVTGRSNYLLCGLGLGIDLLEDPDLLQTAEYAALSAAWYWHDRGLNLLADAGKTEAITRSINGGTHGIDDRVRRLNRITEAMSRCKSG